jgi:hypothetical protein
MGGGQFSIFGAIEEKIGHGFSPVGRFTANARDESFFRWMGGSFRVEGMARRNLVEWAAGLSTGRAQEMQKDSSQLRVARFT